MTTHFDKIKHLLKDVSVQQFYTDCIRGSTSQYYLDLIGHSNPIIVKRNDKQPYVVKKTIQAYINSIANVLKHCQIDEANLDCFDAIRQINTYKPSSCGQNGYSSDDVTTHNQLNHLINKISEIYLNHLKHTNNSTTILPIVNPITSPMIKSVVDPIIKTIVKPKIIEIISSEKNNNENQQKYDELLKKYEKLEQEYQILNKKHQCLKQYITMDKD